MGSLPNTMRAGQWDPKQNKVVINDLSVPEPRPNELLVKITSASLCHSDILAIERPNPDKPFTLGHEAVGIVTKLDPTAEGKGFAVGDAVGFLPIVECCFECEGCMVQSVHCLNSKPQVQGFSRPGFFAEYALVDYRNAIHLPDKWSLTTSSVFFCAGLTAFQSVDGCQLESGQWLGVIGAGGLGQLATQYAKAMGFKVVAVDINDATLEVCKAQGADATFNSRSSEDHVTKIRDLTKGGVHAAAVFSDAQAAYADAPKIIRVGGLLMIVGITRDPLPIPTSAIAMGKYRIKGANIGRPQQMKRSVDFSTKHDIRPQVEIRSLDELDEMVRDMRTGFATKRMVVNF